MKPKPNDILAGLVLAVAALTCFWRLTLHPADLLVGPQAGGNNDVTRYYLSAHERLAKTVSGPDVSACWDPFILAGTPWFGNPQAGVLYPPNWSYVFIPARWLISWMLVGHHWWAGLGAYLLSRRYGYCWSASVLAGTCYLGAPYLLAQSGEGHYAQICLVAWIPLAFLGVERLRKGQRGGIGLTSIVLTLCFFCGHAQETYYLTLLLTAYLLPDFAGFLWRRQTASASGPEPRSAFRLLGRWALVGLAVAGLTAIELLPTWVYSRNSIRAGGMQIEEIRHGVLGGVSLLQLLDPFVLGGPADYRGPGQYYCETLCCLGLPTLIFAVVGIAGTTRRYPVSRFAVLGLAGLLFAFGDQTPVFPLLHRFLPGVSLFRSPSRMLFFCSFCSAMLAGAGFDHLRSLTLEARQRWRIALGAAGVPLLCCGVGVLVSRWTSPTAQPTATTWSATLVHGVAWTSVVALLSGVAGVLWLLTRPVPRATTAVVLALSTAAAGSAWYAAQMLRTIPPESAGRASPVIAFLQTRLGADRVLVGQDLLSDREARLHGIQKLQGYDPVPLARVAIFAAALIPGQDPAMGLAGFEPLRLTSLRKPLADAVGVRYAVLPGFGPGEYAGWRRVSQGVLPAEFTLRGHSPASLRYTIYENPSPMPRAFVVGRSQVVHPDAEAVHELAASDPRDAVLLEQAEPPAGPKQPLRPAQLIKYAASQVTVRALLDQPGYLVLSDAYYPGWTAAVGGRPVPVLPANFAFRAVALEPGEHVVEFRCSPPGLKPGALVSAMTIIALWVGWGRRKRTSALGGGPVLNEIRNTSSRKRPTD